MDKKIFYDQVRVFAGSLTQSQVTGFENILDFWIHSEYFDGRWLAYILATVWHETGKTMQPVRECFASNNSAAVACVTNMFNKGIIKRNYAVPHPNGHSYYGRGYVQLTHSYNYQKVGEMLGIGNQLVNQPDLAMLPPIAVKILVVGMAKGIFTGRKLERYFNNTMEDWFNARRIINGTDKAQQIAEYGQKFYEALKASKMHV